MKKDRLFKFNLIPPRSNEEIETEEERDNSIVSALVLILFTVVIYAVFAIGKVILIDARVINLEDRIVTLNQNISNLQSIKALNGEIFTKSNALAPIIEQDIKLNRLIDVSNKLKENILGAVINSYAREFEGEFVISLTMRSYEDIYTLIDNAKSIEGLEKLFVRDLSKDPSSMTFRSQVEFYLTN